ncbi:PilN domain-containing protein [uncultured Massilia sp.]|uniref:PilN domain-containing protein n=1 Tax=uncultured Massilia sp. TaxID=169973 RepID=UPI0025D51859|nr:PilN domain-containing protein [uncultured Massilia sp.]
MSQQINLFNPGFEKQKNLLSANGMAVAAGMAALAMAGATWFAHVKTGALQAEANTGARLLDQSDKRLAEVTAGTAPAARDATLAGRIADAESQREALRRVAGVIERGELGNTQGYAEYFRALARQRVDGLWLTGVRIGGAGLDLGVQGRALDPALVPGFLARLRNEPVMQGKAVGSLRIGPAEDLKRVDRDGKEGTAPAPYVEFSLQSTPAEDKR